MYHTEEVEPETINFWVGIVTSVPLVRCEQLKKNNDYIVYIILARIIYTLISYNTYVGINGISWSVNRLAHQ